MEKNMQHNAQIRKVIIMNFQELIIDAINFCAYVNNYQIDHERELVKLFDRNMKSALVEVRAYKLYFVFQKHVVSKENVSRQE